MGTQKVTHSSRIITEDFEFTADGETSWAVLCGVDGEIFEVETNNVASYTITGSDLTFDSTTDLLPATVTNQTYYTVSITKTTESASAYVKLKFRIANNKTNIINVPDYSASNGRYLYMLEETNGVIYKLDTDLLLASNYVGDGVWTTTPIIATYTLPTITEGGVWTLLSWVSVGGVEKLIVTGRLLSSTYFFTCTFLIDDELIYDFTETTVDSYDVYSIALTGAGNSVTGVYDYIYQNLYVKWSGSAGVYLTLKYDLASKTYTRISNAFPNYINNTTLGNSNINPYTGYLAEIAAEFDFNGNSYCNKTVTNYSSAGTVFDRDTQCTVGYFANGTYSGWINEKGSVLYALSIPTIVANNIYTLLVRDDTSEVNKYTFLTPASNNPNAIIFIEAYTTNRITDLASSILESTQTTFIGGSMAACRKNGLTLITGGNNDGRKRLYIFKPSTWGTTSGDGVGTYEARYLDFTNNVICITTNQILG